MSAEPIRLSASTVEELRGSDSALTRYIRHRAELGGIRPVEVSVSRFPSEVDVTIWVEREPGDDAWDLASRIATDLQDAGLPVGIIFRATREREVEQSRPAR